jgi:SAM-dependent methyltransferase
MQEQWAEDFAERARAYWTEERTAQLIGSRRPAILPGDAPALLRALGLLHRDGSMPPDRVRKYRQINHMVAVMQPGLRALRDRFETVRILDAACGRSYLSTLLAWHFKHNWKHPVQILGVDFGAPLIEESRRRTALVGLEDVLRFEAAPLQGLDLGKVWNSAFGAIPTTDKGPVVHGVVSLHGCNTATDDAIALAVSEQAELIAVVPCCQSELSSKWANLPEETADGPFKPLQTSRHLRRTTAAHITDLFRLLLIRSAGYEATAIEFVPSEHTPKNTLLRALKTNEPNPKAQEQYEALKTLTGGAGIDLETQLQNKTQPR